MVIKVLTCMVDGDNGTSDALGSNINSWFPGRKGTIHPMTHDEKP
jgi:hypothetical protein